MTILEGLTKYSPGPQSESKNINYEESLNIIGTALSKENVVVVEFIMSGTSDDSTGISTNHLITMWKYGNDLEIAHGFQDLFFFERVAHKMEIGLPLLQEMIKPASGKRDIKVFRDFFGAFSWNDDTKNFFGKFTDIKLDVSEIHTGQPSNTIKSAAHACLNSKVYEKSVCQMPSKQSLSPNGLCSSCKTRPGQTRPDQTRPGQTECLMPNSKIVCDMFNPAKPPAS